MAKKSYEIASEEGVRFLSDPASPAPEIGADVELDLTKEQETALIAAGWLAEPKKKKGG